MKIIDCEQGTHEWFQARCGRITASEIGSVFAKNTRGPLKDISSAERETLKRFLAGEILTGMADEMGYVSAFMERGTELESDARRSYERHAGAMVEEVGFIIHPEIERSGASPDGLVGEEGGLEIKVPGIAKHISYLQAKCLPPEYEPQVMWNLACSGRQWWDFMSYCPTMPRGARNFIVRVYANANRFVAMEEGVLEFLAETDRLCDWIRSEYPESGERVPSFKNNLRESLEDYGDLGITDAELAYLE